MKKVLFVCGSLEPGHDGVGDYTRELAGALQKIGLDTKIIAIRDRNIQNSVSEFQPTRDNRVHVIRLSKSLALSERRKEYLKLLADFEPEWISLQYVPYAFSAKGIPFSLTRFLHTGSDAIKWHFMIHESYIDGNLNLKDRLIKKSQIAVIKSLKRRLKPEIINTSTPLYQTYLESIEIKSEILGLFGNISISKPVQPKISDEIFRGVYFGVSPDFANIHSFVNPLKQFINNFEGKLEIVLCGQSGEKGKRFGSALRSGVNSSRFTVVEKGRMSSEDLSLLFLDMDFGIARIHPRLLGKSGSAIALLEHGLPLWIPLAKSEDDVVAGVEFCVNQCFINLEEVRTNNQKFERGSRLPEIARIFSNALLRKENRAKKV